MLWQFTFTVCYYARLTLGVVFTARRYASAVYAVVVSVRPSVTRRYCTKTVKREHANNAVR